MIKSVFKLLKINHYIKNIVVFVPLIFSLSFVNIRLCGLTIAAFVSFCLISSVVYIFNDIADVQKDRLHPTKKDRPIASGKISIKLAVLILLLLLLTSCTIATTISIIFIAAVLSYLVLNIFYTLYLKQIPIIDVVCIAMGFVIRVLGGCITINVIPSPLVILLTFFTSLFFTFAKRKLEYSMIIDENQQRKSIRQYNEALLNQYVTISAVLAIAFYFTYMLDAQTMQRAGSQFLYLTAIPFTVLFFRLLFLIQTSKNIDDPSVFIYKDSNVKWIAISYLVTFAAVLIL